MPTLGAPLDLAKYEAKNFRAHQLGAAPAAPVSGQLYYDTPSNTLMWFDGTAWQSAKGGVTAPPDASTSAKGVVQLANDLSGTATAPTVVGLHLAADTAINHKLTALTDPVNPQDAASKNYVDGKVGGGGPPVGAAGGDLTGSYPNPTVATGAITSAKILDGTITDVDVAAANKDGANLTPGMRTLGYGGQQALPGNATVDKLASANGVLSMAGHGITSMADPTSASDAATKNYVDNAITGLDAKQSCKAASAGANLTLSGTQTVDGIALVAGDRILVKDQSTAPANGIYVVAAGAWARATDQDAWTEFPGSFTWIEQGTANADTGWICTVDQGGTLGTTSITWTQFSGAAMITTGTGLSKAGSVISANVDGATIDAGGSGGSLEVRAGGISDAQLAAGAVNLTGSKVTGQLSLANGGTGSSTAGGARFWLGAAGYYNNNATHGAGTTITIAGATHNLGTKRAIHVQVQDNTTGNVELPDISVAANGDVTITYGASVSANSKLVTLVG